MRPSAISSSSAITACPGSRELPFFLLSLQMQLQRRDVDVQHRGAAIVQGCKAAPDGSIELIRIVDPLAMGAEGAGDVDKPPLLVLAAGGEPGQERIRLLRDADR